MRVIDVAGKVQPPEVEISVSPAYELLMSLSVFATPRADRGMFEVDANWFSDAERRISPEVRATLEALGSAHHLFAHLMGLAYDTPEPRDVPAFLAHMAEVPAKELRLHLFGYYMGEHHGSVPRDLVRAAAEGEPGAGADLLRHWAGEHGEQANQMKSLVDVDPEASRRFVVDLLHSWYQNVFQTQEAAAMAILKRDAESKRRLADRVSMERLIEVATNGIHYTPEAGVRKVVLMPSVIYRPWVMLSLHQDIRIFCCPVADESLTEDPDAPPVHLLKLYEALADDRRLRVLRKLATEACTLQELADFLGIAKSTMHHHLGILRGAGLLSLESNSKHYTLRREALPDTTSILDAYLKGSAPDQAKG